MVSRSNRFYVAFVLITGLFFVGRVAFSQAENSDANINVIHKDQAFKPVLEKMDFVYNSITNNSILCERRIPFTRGNDPGTKIKHGLLCLTYLNMVTTTHPEILAFQLADKTDAKKKTVLDWKWISNGYLMNIDDYKLRETFSILWSTEGLGPNQEYVGIIKYKINNHVKEIKFRIANGMIIDDYKGHTNCIDVSGENPDLSNFKNENGLDKCGV